VSNSGCTDAREFERERAIVARTLVSGRDVRCVVYFSTCSVDDPESAGTPYVRHKREMEALVRNHPGHLVLRLPQVVGRTPNPHTLLNYLHARIARGERFSLWGRAQRNVIDCDDVRTIAVALIDGGVRAETVNVANAASYPILDIVGTLERVCRGHAVYDVVDRGGAWRIDVSRMMPFADRAGVRFGEGYLERVLRKYYG
jgi:nucleoside-diphosphate-sugar epimerase